MLKAILFDLDDTLIDWSHFEHNWQKIEAVHLEKLYAHLCATIHSFSDQKSFTTAYTQRTRNAWSSARDTLNAPHLGKILVETSVALGLPEDALDEKDLLTAYEWGAVEGTYPFPDVIPGLTMLREQGLRFGIVTNAFQPMWIRDIELQEHGLFDFFPECRFSAADVGRLKPDHAIFKAALDCLDLPPEEVLFIGDNPTADVAGAQSAGMQAVLRVKTPIRPMISGLIVPDAAINSFDELPTALDTLYPGWNQ